METSGLDPEITICKIAVLPIKLCPLIIVVFILRIKYGVFILTVSAYFGTVLYIENKSNKSKKAKAIRVRKQKQEHILISYPKEDLNLYDVISTKLKFVLSTNSSTRTLCN